MFKPTPSANTVMWDFLDRLAAGHPEYNYDDLPEEFVGDPDEYLESENDWEEEEDA